MKGKKFIVIISIVCILAVMLCIPAFATVTESDGDGYALFDTVRLPALPSSDGYIYATIDYSVSNDDGSVNSATLWLSTMKLYRSRASNVVSIVFKAENAGSVSVYDLVIDGASYSWVLSQTRDYNADANVIIDIITLDWSNYNIVNNGVSTDTNGTTFLSATDFIPLDGYNIIEWDGDTTGLVEVYPDVFYTLSPYEYAVDAFAVWNGDTRSIQSSYYALSESLWGISASGITGVDDGSGIVVAAENFELEGAVIDGISVGKSQNYFPSFIAYRTVEEPPNEGGDEPDEPQPPFGAAEIYLKLHPYLLTPQLK